MASDFATIPAIRVDNLTVSYGPKPALLDVSLTIEKGLLVGVIGPNGAGKSTLIKAMLGFVKRDVGKVMIMGQPAEQAKGKVAYVPSKGFGGLGFSHNGGRSGDDGAVWKYTVVSKSG